MNLLADGIPGNLGIQYLQDPIPDLSVLIGNFILVQIFLALHSGPFELPGRSSSTEVPIATVSYSWHVN